MEKELVLGISCEIFMCVVRLMLPEFPRGVGSVWQKDCVCVAIKLN